MKVPVKWLKQFVETDLSAAEIARRMTMAGLEAESIERVGDTWENVFVGEVVRVDPHPDADRLTLPYVVAGEHELTVVTGAPNIAAGQKVALALAGARLIDAYSEELKYRTLKPSKIRGVESEGMVCSEKELGLSDEHEGILVLDDDAPVGMPLADYLGDEVIEFEITPNLVHAFSVLGIARELAAILGQDVIDPPLTDLDTLERRDDRVTIETADHCGRFTYTMFENVTIQPSPDWLQRRLIAADLRPINNYVDISNYVMLELGHPTHPFDADKLASDEIIVRLATQGETITTIDHVERELDGETLVIADKDRAVGIAGIMGGVDSEVTEDTNRVLLESAWFEPKSIRRTSRFLRLSSDASARFGRDIDPNGASVAAARIAELVREIDPGASAVAFADQFLRPRKRREVSMKFSEIERLLGMTVPLERVTEILGRLDLQPSTREVDGELVVTASAPTYRNDINIPADLVEEVIRIHGYEHIPETLITGTAVPVSREPERLVDQITQNALVEAGLFQVQTYTMISDDDLRALSPDGNEVPEVLGGYPRPEESYVRAANPLRSDWVLMRPTMLPSILKVVGENLKFSGPSGRPVRVFETARTYQPAGDDKLPDERRAATIVMSGAREEFGIYASEPEEIDYFDLKGVVEHLLTRLGSENAEFTAVDHPSLHPGRAAAVEIDGVQIGIVGELHPRVAERFAVDRRVAVAEIDLEVFAENLNAPWNVTPVGRHQPIQQDFAIVVPEDVATSKVEDSIRAGAGPLASDIRLFDVYRGENIDPGTKSLAYRVTFAAPDRQPAEHEIERARDRIGNAVAREVGGTLRT